MLRTALRLTAFAALAGVALAPAAQAACQIPRPYIYTCGPGGEFICIDGLSPAGLKDCVPPR